MRRRGFGTVVVVALIAAACSDRPTSPSAPPQVALPQRVELVRGQPVTVPGTPLQLTVRTAPLWMVPSCPVGRESINCGPEGPGVYLDAQAPGRRESFDLMRDTRPARTFDRYEIRLEAISPEPPLYAAPAESGYTVRLLITSANVVP
jgi:hypothetical protein